MPYRGPARAVAAGPSPLDTAQIRDLCARAGVELSEFELARLLRSESRTSVAICAGALIEGRDVLIGVGSIEVSGDAGPDSARVIVDPAHSDGLRELLSHALSGRAAAIAAGRAA